MRMRPLVNFARWFCLAMGIVATGNALAQEREVAARVTALSGQVTAANSAGNIRELRLDSVVYSGETISTGPGSRVRLVFTDGGAKTLRPESRLAIDEYRYHGEPAKDSSVLRLLRGGMRVLTGAIGGANKERYHVGTAVATIGIRGTEYLVRLCQGDCADLQAIGVEPPPNGLYTHTRQGTTVVGGIDVVVGGSSYTNMKRQTQRLSKVPAILAQDPELNAEGVQRGRNELASLERYFDIPAQPLVPRTLVCE